MEDGFGSGIRPALYCLFLGLYLSAYGRAYISPAPQLIRIEGSV